MTLTSTSNMSLLVIDLIFIETIVIIELILEVNVIKKWVERGNKINGKWVKKEGYLICNDSKKNSKSSKWVQKH